MNHEEFIQKWNGRYCDFDGHWGFQCMDLLRQYEQEVHGVKPYEAIPAAANAKQCFYNFRENQYYRKIINGKLNVPKKGDIVFWGYYPGVTGWAGHVGIFDSGDLYTIIAFNQNYPTGSPCLMRRFGYNKYFHGYRGVLGWLEKK